MPSAVRYEGRIGVIELRSLLVADTHIGLARRKRLINSVAALVPTKHRNEFAAELARLMDTRFARNPDNFTVSESTMRALRLLDNVQNGAGW